MNLPPSSAAGPLPTPESFRVLVVDDDHVIVSLLTDVFSSVAGVEVLTAFKPAEAMIILTQQNIDIIFTDVHMPGVTGIEMIRDIVALQKTPEIIVMTAYPSDGIASQAMELGATSLVAKPFVDLALIESELDKAMGRIRKIRASRAEVEAKKEALLVKGEKASDSDPVMKVSLSELPVIPTPVMGSEIKDPLSRKIEEATPPLSASVSDSSVNSQSPPDLKDEVHANQLTIHPSVALDSVIQIEMPRARQMGLSLHLCIIDLPDELNPMGSEDALVRRSELISKVAKCVSAMDAVFDFGRDGLAVLMFGYGEAEIKTLRQKLAELGLSRLGVSELSKDMIKSDDLIRAAQTNLSKKRKLHIVLYESEEFFARIVENMLQGPKYHFSWVQTEKEVSSFLMAESDGVALLVLSLARDPKRWQFILDLKKSDLLRCPILLFSDVPLTPDLKSKLQLLGVRCVVNKGISQEELLYIVQAMVMPKGKAEERKSCRAVVRVPLVYELNGMTHTSNSFTLSRDGVFIRDINPPVSGSWMKLKIFIPGHREPFESGGEVLYAVPYFVGVHRFHIPGMAVRFTTLSEDKRQALDDFVKVCFDTYMLS